MTARLPARLLFAVCALLPLTLGAAPAGTLPLSAFPRERIAVETRASFRRLMFEAWRAETPQTREQGFMFVEDRDVRPDQAMVFIYDPPQYVAMWMKNTLLPLDMLFIDQHGCVVTIKQNAQPGSLAEIKSRVPVSLVVELRAGTVAAQGIAVGDRVLRPASNWPAGPAACSNTDQ